MAKASIKKNLKMFNVNPNCKELIEKGLCKADCCGLVPFPEKSWEELKDKANKLKEYELVKFQAKGETFVIPTTKDYKCVFLSFNHTCNIYNEPQRPNICMLYGKVNNEPLLACPHINKDKEGVINNVAEKTMSELKNMEIKGEIWK